MKDRKPDMFTVGQLEQLGYGGDKKHERPLLVCDVDEVVLHLVDPFVAVLEERGFTLKSHSFKLTGNVFDAQTGREATQDEVWSGLTQLFDEQAQRQAIVDGVIDGLHSVAQDVDVLFLTNMPHTFADTRRAHLANHTLNFPLVTNTGSKVPAIKMIADHCAHPIGFIDDTPRNLEQVREHLPNVHLFHFMANENFRELAGQIEGAKISTGNWVEASSAIRNVMMENIGGT